MANLTDQLRHDLDSLRAAGLYRTLRTVGSAQGPRIVVGGREFLNFSSNDYLGLANHPALKRAATAAIKRYGVGAGASRLVCGNLAPYDELERRLAAFKGKEAAIVFGSGYAANVGTITALVGADDVVILDKLNHASIIDGARQSGATIRVYPHGNLRKLEELLQWAADNRGKNAAPTNPPTTCSLVRTASAPGTATTGSVGAAFLPRPGRILVITETVFSMDGDLAPLAEIAALKEQYGAWLMVDEAHATGVFGKHRRGLAEELGIEEKVDVTLGTLSKALGGAGGFVAGNQTLIDYLRNRARSLIYSTALPPAVVAAASAAVALVAGKEGQQRCERLWANVRALGATSPIHPVIVGAETAAVELSRQLSAQGIFVPAIRYPTVAKGQARLRVTVTAAHEAADMARLQKVVANCRGKNAAPTSAQEHVAGDQEQVLDEQGPVVGAAFLPRPAVRPPHSADLRKGRVSMPRECYFLTTCVAERQPVLAAPAAARVVVDSLRRLRDQGRIRLLGFVVMPDHVHVALVLPSRAEARSYHTGEGRSDLPVATLAEIMRSFKGFTTHRLGGSVWQPGYHDHHLQDRESFDKHLKYMHDNPVRRGLVKLAEQWPFSTAHPDYQHEIDWAWVPGVKPQ